MTDDLKERQIKYAIDMGARKERAPLFMWLWRYYHGVKHVRASIRSWRPLLDQACADGVRCKNGDLPTTTHMSQTWARVTRKRDHLEGRLAELTAEDGDRALRLVTSEARADENGTLEVTIPGSPSLVPGMPLEEWIRRILTGLEHHTARGVSLH